MKKIIAILLALAVVSMAFAQTVSISNKLDTMLEVEIGGGQWHFNSDTGVLRDTISGSATTADGRASIEAEVSGVLDVKDDANAAIASFTPRWTMKVAQGKVNATIRPFEMLEIGLGTSMWTSMGPGLANEGTFVGKSLDWRHTLAVNKGVYAKFVGAGVGVNGLEVLAGVELNTTGAYAGMTKTPGATSDAWLAKNMFSGAIGAKYDTDLFAIGARWKSYIGYDVVSGADEKGYYTHDFYVGGTFKGLQSLPVGITIDAGLSGVMTKGLVSTSEFSVGAGASFNFNNGIITAPKASVTFGKDGAGNSYKMLPFTVQNDLTFNASDVATFTLLTAYSQSGATMKAKEITAAGVLQNKVTVKPSFTWKNGPHSFNFGVNTVINGSMQYVEKTERDWAFTRMTVDSAKFQLPVSWTYQF